MNNTKQVTAYLDKTIVIANKKYKLVAEKSKGSCVGCDRINLQTCCSDRTDEGAAPTRYCRQGFILKEVKE